MSVILPCLFLAALGLAFGVVHMIAYKAASDEDIAPEEQTRTLCGGAHCGACGFACPAAGGEAPEKCPKAKE